MPGEPAPRRLTLTQHIRHQATAPKSLAGKRFDQVAAAVFPDFSRARLQQWIREGMLTVDGQAAKPTFKLQGGESLQLDAELQPEAAAKPQNIPLDILYADDDIVVLNKAAGIVVHPAPGNPDGTLLNALLNFDPALANVPRAGLVHRLDKDTSGVMVVARSLKAHASLVDQLQSRRMSRVYRAVALGELISGGTVSAPIGRHPRDRKRMAVVSSGKPAVTHLRIVERFEGFTHLEVSLETGRTHQIRVHLASQGFALLGDPVYGRRVPRSKAMAEMPQAFVTAIREFGRQALHAWRLTLEHPASGSEQRFEAPLPEDFARLLRTLRKFAPKKQ